jgi:UDP-2,3-diacylglucosamine pyrophosphatase LpxH
MNKKYKTVFISDVHLGSRYSNAESASRFLKENTCEKLILNGDIIDGWKLRRKWFFPQSHLNFVRRVLTDTKRNTEVIYIPGNHDEMIRPWMILGINFGNIIFENEHDHYDIHGNKWLVTHGDLFDAIMTVRWLTWLGDHIYTILTASNYLINRFRNKFGYGYWSLSQWAKSKTKESLNYIYKFEEHLAQYAKSKGYYGVICGHIHFPSIKTIDGIVYMNIGDFCETCSAIVERHDGVFELHVMDKNGYFKIKKIFGEPKKILESLSL